MSTSLDLDHLGIAVGDLDEAARIWRALGFTLTDKSYHVAAKQPGGKLEPAGTGNHCIMLGRGYVELIAVTDPAYQGRLRADLARYEGLHLVSFGSHDADATAAAFSRSTGVPTAPRRLTRPIAERGIAQIAAFDIVDLPDSIAGFGHFFAIQHLTREALWQKHLTMHGNGATALLGAIVCVAEPSVWLQRLATSLGMSHRAQAIMLAAGRVEALDPAALGIRFAGAKPPAMPCLAGLTLGVADLASLARHLTAERIPFTESVERIWVAAGQANGTILEFVAPP